MRTLCQLLATVSLALLPTAALAQAPAPAATGSGELAEIIVFGQGQTRQVAEVKADQIRLLTPGSSPFLAIERLPGVNFQSADPFGAYEWSTRITLRGFNQNQLGFTLDGLPLGDMSYGNHNGLHISRAIISDNIAVTRVSQGAGALATASTSNLGGTLEFTSREPARDLGLSANGTFGASSTWRLFGRLDTGEIGALRASLSAAHLEAGKWKGEGVQRHTQLNFKVVADAGNGSTVTGFANFSDRRENDYQDLSLEMIDRLGYRWDNFAPNWRKAVLVAQIAQNRGDVGGGPSNPTVGTTYPSPITSVDDAYFDAAGLRRDWLAGLRLAADLNENVSASVHPYVHLNRGQGIWFTPYVRTPGGAPISVRTTEYDIERFGLVVDLQARLDPVDLSAGIWVEENSFVQGRRFYGLEDSTRPSRSSLSFQKNPFRTQWRFDFNTSTVQPYVQGRVALAETLDVSLGFKAQSVRNRSRRLVPGVSPAAGSIRSEDWFLPQAGVLWRAAERQELFFNYTENQRAFVTAATTGPFSTTQAGFDAIRTTLKPESSRTFEGGWRFGAGPVRGVVAGYVVDFRNRLLGITTGAGIVGNPVVLQNVGSVRSVGAELGAAASLLADLTLFGSYSFNRSTYEDDVVNAAGVVIAPIKGRTVVDTPRHMAKVELSYDPASGPFGRIGASHQSKRFFTFTNDQSVSGRTLVDATLGWRFAGEGLLGGLAVQASVTNLLDKDYVATIGSNGFGNRGDNQTLLAGAPRQWFLTMRKDF
jgi:iron complex outermembrane receptor protein